ncbi:hypothetical protein T484DRAFT_1769328 [Baffinella frigidus]|nr:hypothetical protein T484DRAFT_1769328 [Cryptophyta sp. CCMP2293]
MVSMDRRQLNTPKSLRTPLTRLMRYDERQKINTPKLPVFPRPQSAQEWGSLMRYDERRKINTPKLPVFPRPQSAQAPLAFS